MNRRTFLTLGGAAAAALVLGGCGFRLRGTDALLGLPSLALEGDDTSELYRLLRMRLEQRGAEVRSDGEWRVTLGSAERRSRQLGSDGRGSREHELTLTTSLSVQQRENGAYRLNNETLSVRTRIRVNDDNLLNRDSLFREAERTLEQRLAERIIERLGYLAGQV